MSTAISLYDARSRITNKIQSLTNQINIEFTQVIKIALKENLNRIAKSVREIRSFSQKFDMRHFNDDSAGGGLGLLEQYISFHASYFCLFYLVPWVLRMNLTS